MPSKNRWELPLRSFRCWDLIICAILIFISACVAPVATSYSTAQGDGVRPLEPEGLPLTFQVSGGFAGRIESLDITLDGMATWTDMRSRTTRSQQLTPPSLARLQVLLAVVPAAEISDGGSRIPGRAPDGFEYRLTMPSTGKSREILVQSGRLAESVHRELIGLLLAINNEVRKGSQ